MKSTQSRDMNSPTTSRLENETISATSISRTIFRTLPIDVQMDYARFYSLPNSDNLTTDDICGALFRETEWTPALDIEGHVRFVTADGVVVAREAMDLVDWIVVNHISTTSGPIVRTPKSPENHVEAQPERTSRDYLERMAEQLQKAHSLIRAAIEASREAAREACADVFILRGRLADEHAHQDAALKSITSFAGIENMQGSQQHPDVARGDGQSPMFKSSSGTLQKPPKNPQDSLPFHTLRFEGIQDVSGSDVYSVPPTSGSSGGTKRPLDIDAEPATNAHDLSCSHRHKRPRLDEPVQNNAATLRVHAIHIPQTILNYPSDEEQNEVDSSYSDSNGTERDFIDDPYSFYGPNRVKPIHELRSPRCLSENDSDVSDSVGSFRWSATESDSECLDDPDYSPIADWDLEDVLELENNGLFGGLFPLYKFKYMDELFDCCEVLSDGGISSDDSEHGYLYPEMLQRSALTRYDGRTLGPLLCDPLQRYYDDLSDSQSRPTFDNATIARLKKREIARLRENRWISTKISSQNQTFRPLDVDSRLDQILTSDHSLFYFDAIEWMHFVEPSPALFSPYVNLRPRVL